MEYAVGMPVTIGSKHAERNFYEDAVGKEGRITEVPLDPRDSFEVAIPRKKETNSIFTYSSPEEYWYIRREDLLITSNKHAKYFLDRGE